MRLGARPGNAVDRISKFFRDNPDEELTPQQVMEKFSISDATDSKCMQELEACGQIERVFVVRNRSKGIAS